MSNTNPRSSEAPGFFQWLMSPGLMAVVGTVGCLPLLFVHFQQLWSRPHYQYFPMVLVAVVILYLLRRTDPNQEPTRPRPFLAGLALLGGLALAAYAVLRLSPLLCCAAWVLMLWAYVLRSSFDVWSPWALLCLLLRLPQGRDIQLIQWFHEITTRTSSAVLDQLRIDHFREGNVLVFPDRKLFVEEASSGVVSLFTILATAAVFGAFLRRSWFHTLLLMAAGAFWAGAANVLRVVVIAAFLERMGIDLTAGWPHDLLGLGVYCVTLVILFSTDGLLRFLFGPIEIDESSSSEMIYENRAVRIWNHLFWPRHEQPMGLLSERPNYPPHRAGFVWFVVMLLTIAGFGSLGALQVWGGIGPFSAYLGIGPAIDGLGRESLPQEFAGWTLTGFRREKRSASSEFGERSRQWIFERGGQTATVSVDYPFPEWHDLSVCYRGVGWTPGPRTPLGDQTTAVQHSLQNDQQSGWLIFDMFDQQGDQFTPSTGQRIHPRWKRLFSGDASRWTLPTFYQVQVFSVSPTLEPLDPQGESVAHIQQLFTAFRTAIRSHATPSPAGGQP